MRLEAQLIRVPYGSEPKNGQQAAARPLAAQFHRSVHISFANSSVIGSDSLAYLMLQRSVAIEPKEIRYANNRR